MTINDLLTLLDKLVELRPGLLPVLRRHATPTLYKEMVELLDEADELLSRGGRTN